MASFCFVKTKATKQHKQTHRQQSTVQLYLCTQHTSIIALNTLAHYDHRSKLLRMNYMNQQPQPYAQQAYQHDGKSAETRNLKPGELSTGTTIMAIPFKDGVVLGADSRVSTGTYVANRVSDKVAQLHDHIWCCRSGSAADTQALTDYVRHYLSQLA